MARLTSLGYADNIDSHLDEMDKKTDEDYDTDTDVTGEELEEGEEEASDLIGTDQAEDEDEDSNTVGYNVDNFIYGTTNSNIHMIAKRLNNQTAEEELDLCCKV